MARGGGQSDQQRQPELREQCGWIAGLSHLWPRPGSGVYHAPADAGKEVAAQPCALYGKVHNSKLIGHPRAVTSAEVQLYMRGLALAASVAMAASVLAAETAQERLVDSARVFSEIMKTPDKGIPQDLLAKAQCVVIIPGMKKAAFVVGAEYGRGFAECRHEDGKGWGAPAAVRMEGGSVGFQIGG